MAEPKRDLILFDETDLEQAMAAVRREMYDCGGPERCFVCAQQERWLEWAKRRELELFGIDPDV